jgi:hypothetical protein
MRIRRDWRKRETCKKIRIYGDREGGRDKPVAVGVHAVPLG